jgi:hypothetical protein
MRAANRARRALPIEAWLWGLVPALLPASAHASFLSPELIDTAATYIAWFVLCVMPIGGIVLFWIVHVLPVKMAERRHHPQTDAIHTLCLLSLVFGGLLWPLAWLWASVKPAGYQLAYGTDKHEDYFHEQGARAKAGELLDDEIAHLRAELDAMAKKGSLPPKLRALRDDLAAAQSKSAAAGPDGRNA